jgi:transposase
MLSACARCWSACPVVTVIGVGDWLSWLRVVVTADADRPGCSSGGPVHRHGVREVVLVDLPMFGPPTRLAWHKQRLRCTACGVCWCDENPQIGTSRCLLTTRAARWVTVQVGRHGRSVAEIAADLGCSWYAVMDAVVAVGEQVIGHPDRIGAVTALGLDETLFAKMGTFRSAPSRGRPRSSRSAGSAAPSHTGPPRSLHGIARTSPTGRPKPSTTWRNGSSASRSCS